MTHEYYMRRCFELAEKGLGNTLSNPMVGCIIVHNNTIIGEGYHKKFGLAHAEVNAIGSVKDQSLLAESTLYVNLEPCSHHGKTPPCSDLIIEKGIKKVIISNRDPNPLVAGKGIEKLKSHGIEVEDGLLSHEGRELNRRFFTFHEKKRPFIILKWAQTADGYISRYPIPSKEENWITGAQSKKLTHLWRSQEQAIFIGTNTALNDDPELTTRLVEGENPFRVVIDKKLIIPMNSKIFRDDTQVFVFTEQEKEGAGHIHYHKTDFSEDALPEILGELYKHDIISVIVEGGAILLNSFLQQGLWDEARVFVAPTTFGEGIKAPEFILEGKDFSLIGEDRLVMARNW